MSATDRPRAVEDRGTETTRPDADARRRPDAPDALGDAGRELWEAITADLAPDWELDARELALLGEAARLSDALALLDAAVAADGATVKGSKGQPVVHPAIGEARQHRIALARLLGALGLTPPATGSRGGSTAASARARRAAQARWTGRGRA
jgi:P27 family predicted phage terminase small subunit